MIKGISKSMLREWTKNFLATILVMTLCYLAIAKGLLLEVVGTMVGAVIGYYFGVKTNKEEVKNEVKNE